jgi:triphosphoribosyl-dephospho-CoA synthetase
LRSFCWKQYQSALDLVQKAGENGLVQESRAAFAELAIEEGHPDQAESLIRPAIAEFEQEKSDPASAGAYMVLSRALQALGKLEEARAAAQHASMLSRTSSDPALRFPAAIQLARVEMASEGNSVSHPSLQSALTLLNSTVESAKRLGYYELECEGRLALGELELKRNRVQGQAQLSVLASEARQHGLELIAQKAEHGSRTSTGMLAAIRPVE